MTRFDLSLVIGLSLLVYAGFCMVKGGTHVRGKGWVSKFTNPIAYRVNQILFFLLGFSMIISNFIFVE
jgi:hypothetical protein